MFRTEIEDILRALTDLFGWTGTVRTFLYFGHLIEVTKILFITTKKIPKLVLKN